MEPIESLIIRDLYKSNDWVDLYSIHKKYLLSPIQMLGFCQASSEKGIIEIEGRMARITDFGRIWSIKNRHRIFSSERPWAKGSSYLRKDRRAVEQPYLPKLELLEKDFFLGLLRSEQK